MVRWLVRGTLLAVLCVALLVVALWLMFAASLPRLEGKAALPGLSSPVTVERDALGVVTISARDRLDAMRALGHVHAQERYFEMDLMRRTSAGELAALFGPEAIEVDKRHRIHRMRARVQEHLDAITGDQREMLQAYVDGVNAGLAGLKSRPWPYLLLRRTPEPWRLEDSALAAYAMYFDLQDAANADELALWKLRPHLPEPLFKLVTHGGSRWDAPIVGPAIGDAPLPGPGEVDLRQLPLDESVAIAPLPKLPDLPMKGSNNFAVAGTMTRDGRAIVADDMHLGLRAPNIWFRVRLRYPDRNAPRGRVDATGFTLPGLPAIVVGSNGHVAWAFTNSYGDWLDWQKLPPCRDDGTDCMPGTTVVERIEVAGGEPVDFEIEETDWGPVMHRDADGNRLALRWVAHLPGSLTMELSRFVDAGTVNAALRIADDTAIPAQNLLVGDARGRIAWRLLGPIPDRADQCIASPLASTDGNDAIPAPATCPPWALDSASGISVSGPGTPRLWTANSRVVDGDMLARIGDGGYALGARGQQIRDALEARNRLDEKALLRIQLDDRALFLERWRGLLLQQAAQARTPALEALAAASRDWSSRASTDSAGYRLVRGWRMKVLERIADGLVAPARESLGDDFTMPALRQLEGVAWPLIIEQPMHLLSPRYDSWQALFEDAAADLRDELAGQGPLSERSWGERNTARICHPLAGALPGFARPLLCMPAEPLPGDANMPRVQGPDFGASERMVVSPGHEAEGIAHMPGGQSGHLLSPFWGAGHDDWVQGRPTPFLPGPARYTLTLAPDRD